MADEQTPTPPPAGGWWAAVPDPVRKYALQLVIWLVFAAAGWVAAKLGTTAPPPPVLAPAPAADADAPPL